jgi:predicted O-methyltransferase YrrM
MLDEPKIASVLAELHERSDRQLRLLRPLSIARRLGGWVGLSIDLNKPAMRALLGDKLVALDPDKARLCYLLCRTIGARHVVEVGTSFGVSTIYLAAAVRETGGNGMVIGTEQEPAKVAGARTNLSRAGLADVVDIREGDVRETLRDVGGPIDFVLMDIWAPMARPALDLLIPQLRPGAMVLCDNVERFRRDYRHYLDRVRDPRGGFRSTTLPYDGGFELAVWLE